MADAYLTGLKLLAGRELSEAQMRMRLTRRKFGSEEIDSAVARLRHEGSLDDRRTALACARSEAHVKRHGTARALRQLQALGISRGVAKTAVAEVFADLDEDDLIANALERRLRHGASLENAAIQRRLYRYLLGQGFDAARVQAAIRSRVNRVRHDE